MAETGFHLLLITDGENTDRQIKTDKTTNDGHNKKKKRAPHDIVTMCSVLHAFT